MNTALELSNVTLSSDTCFSFYFEMKKDSGVNKMKVIIEQSSGDQHEIWTYTSKLDFWDFGQILIQKNTNFKVASLIQQATFKCFFERSLFLLSMGLILDLQLWMIFILRQTVMESFVQQDQSLKEVQLLEQTVSHKESSHVLMEVCSKIC